MFASSFVTAILGREWTHDRFKPFLLSVFLPLTFVTSENTNTNLIKGYKFKNSALFFLELKIFKPVSLFLQPVGCQF